MRTWLLLCCCALWAATAGQAQDEQALVRAETLPPHAMWVESLDLLWMDTGSGRPMAGRSMGGQPLTLHGVRYPHGVGTHATSEFTITLNGAARRFMSAAGVDDEVPRGAGSVVFSVEVDGKTRWHSRVLRSVDEPDFVSVDLSKAKTLVLRVGDAGDGVDSDHADWAGALLLLDPAATAKPSSEPQPMYSVATLGLPKDWRDALDKGNECFKHAYHELAAFYYREALRFGAPDGAGWDWAMNFLGWSYRKAGFYKEALAIAQQRWQTTKDAIGLALLGNAAYLVTDFELAKRCVAQYDQEKAGLRDRDDPSAISEMESLRGLLETRTYRVTWTLTPQQIKEQLAEQKSPTLICQVPQTVKDFQQVHEIKVSGATSYTLKEDSYFDNAYFEITPSPEKPLVIVATFTQRPFVWRSRLKEYVDGTLPDGPKHFLGKSWWGDQLWIDPDGELAQNLAKRLRGGSTIDSIENVLRYLDHWLSIPGHRHPTSLPATSESVLKYGAGDCQAGAITYVAVLRAMGVPARLVRGELHTVPEYFVNGVGWMPHQPGPALPLWMPNMFFFPKMHYAGERRLDSAMEWVRRDGGLVAGCNRLDFHGEVEIIDRRIEIEIK